MNLSQYEEALALIANLERQLVILEKLTDRQSEIGSVKKALARLKLSVEES